MPGLLRGIRGEAIRIAVDLSGIVAVARSSADRHHQAASQNKPFRERHH
jgi:hypothetical protein